MFGMTVADIGNRGHGDNAFGNRASIVEKTTEGGQGKTLPSCFLEIPY